MALPVTIPNQFANATSSIPLSQLDTNFNTLSNAVNGINSGAETLANLVATTANVTTGNITTVNATTVDTTNIEVTNIKAKDGTASVSIADSTGVFTHATTTVFPAGAVGTPAITTTGDTNTGIFFPAADTIAFAEGGAEAMRIDSSGNVGIGTTTVRGDLNIYTSAANFSTDQDGDYGSLFVQGGNDNTSESLHGAISFGKGISSVGRESYKYGAIALVQTTADVDQNGLAFFVSPNADQTSPGTIAEAMRIDSAGNVGIGTSSPSAKLDVIGGIRAGAGSDQGTQLNMWTMAGGDAGLAAFTLGFYTGSNNSRSERMRIDSSGNLLIGYTSSNGSYKLQVNSQIFATNATIATSDGRYKENIQTLDGALSLVSQLNPVQFSWKEHPVHNFDRSGPTIGFIAQEVEQVLVDKPYLNSIIKRNECVIEPEEKDAEGNITKEAVTEEFLGIAEGNMIALLTKALQELKADFDAYKASHP